MHKLAAIPGDPSEGNAALVEQMPAEMLLLSSADSDLALLAALGQRQGSLLADGLQLRALNLAVLAHPAAIDHYLRNTARQARLVVVRLLGGRGHWSYGLEQLREWAQEDPRRALVVLSGTEECGEELASLGSAPLAVALAMAECLQQGGPHNLEQVLASCSGWLTGKGWQAPTPLPLGDPLSYGWNSDPGARVGVLFYRSLWSSGDLELLDACLASLRQRGLCPRMLLVSSLRDRVVQQAVQRLLERERVEAVICGTGFASVSADAAAAGAPLWRKLGVPVLQLLCSTGSHERWQASSVGLSPLDLSMQVALPELDGRLTSRVGSFKEMVGSDQQLQCAIQRYRPIPERLSWVAELCQRWVQLRHTPASQKRLAIVLANYPTRNGRLANGVGLDTPASAAALLGWLQAEGYQLSDAPLPRDGDGLIQLLTGGRTPDPESWHLPACAHLPLATYQGWFASLPAAAQARLLERWGPPEQDPSLEAPGFAIAGILLGQVVVLLQPGRGYDRDPALSYHSPELPPTHAYLAHYLWIREYFAAHAVLHLGKHGNLEWLPGKGVGLSEQCFPELALGPMPNIYPFIVNDPGEGSQAKRRSQALILDHLTPPLGRAGLHGELQRLEGLLDEYWEASQLGSERQVPLRSELAKRLEQMQLPGQAADFEQRLSNADGYLCELKEAQIRTGLHVYGCEPAVAAHHELLQAIARSPGPGRLGLTRAMALDLQLSLDPWSDEEGAELTDADRCRLIELARRQNSPVGSTLRSVGDAMALLEDQALALLHGEPLVSSTGNHCSKELEQIESQLRPQLLACAPAERANLLAALRGERIEAGPSGAPTRGRPDVLPTGRNFYAVDLRAVPTEVAWDLGRRSAEILLEQHLQQQGEALTNLAISIWGTSTMRSGGDDVAQVLALMGVRPHWDGASRRMAGLELIPLAALGRPRVEVTVRISGFFRDAFPQLVGWLNEADRMVRKQAPAEGGEAGGCVVYGSAPGAYGAGLQELIDSGAWQHSDDLAEAFLQWSRWRHHGDGSTSDDRSGLEQRLGQVQVVLHNQDNREHDLLDSDDYYQFQGGLAAAARRLQGRMPGLWFGDHSRPERPRPRPLALELDKVIRSRLLNPRWLEGMQNHGYKGGFELAASLDYLFAYDATTQMVPDWAYGAICEQWLADPKLRSFLERSNPWALRDMAERLLEAHHRGLWEGAETAQLQQLQELVLSSEASIETGSAPAISRGL
jgi:cobaltochelatase CobN